MLKLPEDWAEALGGHEEQEEYFLAIRNYLNQRYKAGAVIFPAVDNVLRAFRETPFDHVKVVLIGQDPYPAPGDACGLCFAVEPNPARRSYPPSLVNIFKEMQSDLGLSELPHPDIMHSWPGQGVLMLNSTLTVEAGKPMAHGKIGWQTFTDKVISCISQKKDGVVFLLWGRYAQGKAALIDASRHHILTAAHPSPLAQGRFFGSRPFSQTNAILGPARAIDWTRLPQPTNQPNRQ